MAALRLTARGVGSIDPLRAVSAVDPSHMAVCGRKGAFSLLLAYGAGEPGTWLEISSTTSRLGLEHCVRRWKLSSTVLGDSEDGVRHLP